MRRPFDFLSLFRLFVNSETLLVPRMTSIDDTVVVFDDNQILAILMLERAAEDLALHIRGGIGIDDETKTAPHFTLSIQYRPVHCFKKRPVSYFRITVEENKGLFSKLKRRCSAAAMHDGELWSCDGTVCGTINELTTHILNTLVDRYNSE